MYIYNFFKTFQMLSLRILPPMPFLYSVLYEIHVPAHVNEFIIDRQQHHQQRLANQEAKEILRGTQERTM